MTYLIVNKIVACYTCPGRSWVLLKIFNYIIFILY